MLPFGIQYVNTNAHAQYVLRRQQHPNCILGLERSTTRHLITCAGRRVVLMMAKQQQTFLVAVLTYVLWSAAVNGELTELT